MQDDDRRRDNCFDVAARFVADQPGGPGRLLNEHRPDDRGLCCGCLRPGTGMTYLPWPCPITRIAQAAADIQPWRQRSDLNPMDTSPEALDKTRLTRSLDRGPGRHTRPD
jgi:hypothetical protein